MALETAFTAFAGGDLAFAGGDFALVDLTSVLMGEDFESVLFLEFLVTEAVFFGDSVSDFLIESWEEEDSVSLDEDDSEPLEEELEFEESDVEADEDSVDEAS